MDTLINEIIESELVDSTLYLSTTDQGNDSLRVLSDFMSLMTKWTIFFKEYLVQNSKDFTNGWKRLDAQLAFPSVFDSWCYTGS
jgi:hypothetical protein